MSIAAAPTTTLDPAPVTRPAGRKRRTERPEGLHVVKDPRPGHVVEVPAGSRLQVTFQRRGLGLSQWRVEDRPGHLVSLVEGGHDFHFLVFDIAPGEARPLRLARYRPDSDGPASEVRDIVVRGAAAS